MTQMFWFVFDARGTLLARVECGARGMRSVFSGSEDARLRVKLERIRLRGVSVSRVRTSSTKVDRMIHEVARVPVASSMGAEAFPRELASMGWRVLPVPASHMMFWKGLRSAGLPALAQFRVLEKSLAQPVEILNVWMSVLDAAK